MKSVAWSPSGGETLVVCVQFRSLGDEFLEAVREMAPDLVVMSEMDGGEIWMRVSEKRSRAGRRDLERGEEIGGGERRRYRGGARTCRVWRGDRPGCSQ